MPPQPNFPNNSEIDQALKEFEAKSEGQEYPIVNAIITPQKSQNTESVSFNEDSTDKYKVIESYKEASTPKMVKFVIRVSGGAIKDQRQAEWVLLGVVVIVMGISLYLFFWESGLNLISTKSTKVSMPVDQNIPSTFSQ